MKYKHILVIIGVGTERKIIEQAYKNSYGSLMQDTLYKEIYHVEDGNCALQFYFDEEGKAKKLIICNTDIYHKSNTKYNIRPLEECSVP